MPRGFLNVTVERPRVRAVASGKHRRYKGSHRPIDRTLPTIVGGSITRRDVLLATSLSASAAALTAIPNSSRVPSYVANSQLANKSGRRIRAEFQRLVRASGQRLYVSGTGSDSAAGTFDAPLREINTAIKRSAPGDRIIVGSGTYGYTHVNGFQGLPDAWLSIATASDAVQAKVYVPPSTDNFVNITDSEYVGLYGFEVVGDLTNPNTNGSGISIYGNSHHVAIWANTVHDFPGGGINCFDVNGSHDLIDISYNRIYRTSLYSPQNTSAISVYAARDLTDGATLAGGYGYRIRGNYIHGVRCVVPYSIGGFDDVTDGNGISIDRLVDSHDYNKPVLVEGNLVTGCGGRAVHVFNSVNVLAVSNTAIGNMTTDSKYISGGCELDGNTDRSVRYVRNVVMPRADSGTVDASSSYSQNIFLGGRGAVPPNNVDLRSLGANFFKQLPSATVIRDGGRPGMFEPSDIYG